MFAGSLGGRCSHCRFFWKQSAYFVPGPPGFVFVCTVSAYVNFTVTLAVTQEASPVTLLVDDGNDDFPARVSVTQLSALFLLDSRQPAIQLAPIIKRLSVFLNSLISLFLCRRGLAFENLLLWQQTAVLKEKGVLHQISIVDRSFRGAVLEVVARAGRSAPHYPARNGH